ncbi:MAG: Phenol hydroxylase, oxygenase component DmpL [Polyangiaceae bacterium]|jgi:toluene monooxygenase system protein E|nr:Phenol hydroxylase, oxygenase component DmpL [Polyangiaceae bacterium]
MTTSPREIRAARAITARRTYSCLEGSRRKPTDYEVTSTELLYYPQRGFEVDSPVLRHYSPAPGWEAFRDPAALTYAGYVAERRDQEAFLDRLLERPTRELPSALRPLLGIFSALRFALHGLQMTAAYVGAFAPSGRIAIAAAFQAADEMRRIQRICQWLSRSGKRSVELDALGRELWQQGAELQPLRRLVEELLVTYDWQHALVALNGVVKPLFDRLWFEQLVGLAERHDDEVLEKILSSLGDDGLWHESWFIAFAKLAQEVDPLNTDRLRAEVLTWRPKAANATQALLPAFGSLLGDEGERAYVWRELDGGLSAHLSKAGLVVATNAEASHGESL